MPRCVQRAGPGVGRDGEADAAAGRVLCSERASWPPAWALLLATSVPWQVPSPQTPAPWLLAIYMGVGITPEEVLTSDALPSSDVPESCRFEAGWTPMENPTASKTVWK